MPYSHASATREAAGLPAASGVRLASGSVGGMRRDELVALADRMLAAVRSFASPGHGRVTLPGPEGKPGVYFLVEYATTSEIYYNTKMFADYGITVPAGGQFSEDAFKEAVKTITGKGTAAFANANDTPRTPSCGAAWMRPLLSRPAPRPKK